ncbi:MAG TPA: sugar phosphate isomerase/epimerase family protein [Armatimonadota bacterium]|nr:sugar phosphate isomerase/epimerase family protein [Armatimonadota bacterium]
MTPSLPLSVPDWCFFQQWHDKPDAYYQQLHHLGITGVEMVEQGRWSIARQAGLRLMNISGPGMADGLNNPAHHAELVTQLGETITLARQHDISAVIVFSGNRHGIATDEGIENCITSLQQLVPLAEKAGVTLLFEMLNAFDHADYQADHSAFGFEIVRRINSPSVRVLYDIYHMQRMDEDVIRDLVDNIEYIGHIHVAESPRRTRPVAAGVLSYRDIIPAVIAAGYRGYWGLEFLPEGDAMDEIAKAVSDMQHCNTVMNS